MCAAAPATTALVSPSPSATTGVPAVTTAAPVTPTPATPEPADRASDAGSPPGQTPEPLPELPGTCLNRRLHGRARLRGSCGDAAPPRALMLRCHACGTPCHERPTYEHAVHPAGQPETPVQMETPAPTSPPATSGRPLHLLLLPGLMQCMCPPPLLGLCVTATAVSEL